MKKFVFIMMLCAVLLVVAAPLLAGPPEVTGTRINLIGGTPTTLPAGDPFFIGHGWVFDPEWAPAGHFDFRLDIDGEYQPMSHFSVQWDDPYLIRFWVFNYPEGMTGVHTFTGHWILPCQFAMDNGMYPGPCPNPNEEVEVHIADPLTVTFTP